MVLERQTQKLTAILKDENIQNYAGECFWNLIQAVVTGEPSYTLETGRSIKEVLFHMPTALFWDKMKRFLMGTFHNYKDQVEMAKKFNNDNKKYAVFVKRQIHLINNLDDDMKIDYFATLTRSMLMSDLEETLYFKLCKFLSVCTREELDFIRKCPYDFKGENSAIISSLLQYGLFTQEEGIKGETLYVFSDFAKALKQNSLNFEEGLSEKSRLVTYEQLSPLNLIEALTAEEVGAAWDDVFNNQEQK